MRLKNAAIAAMALLGLLVAAAQPASATLITVSGSYSVAISNTVGNAPSITYDLGSGIQHNFTKTLSTGAAPTTPVDLITVTPAGTCGVGCVNHTASATLTLTFNITTPSGVTGNFTDTALYQADYNGHLACATNSTGNQTDCVTWSTANDPMLLNLNDGYFLSIHLIDAEDWAITPTVTFQLVDPPPSVPEPTSLALLGTAIGGVGLTRFRRCRKAAKKSA